MSKPCTRRNLTIDEYRKWNALYSCRKLARMIEANFAADAAYYVIALDAKGFSMDRDGALEDFKTDVIKPLRPLVKGLKYIYGIHQNTEGQLFVHIVTNAAPDAIQKAFARFWMYSGIYDVQRVGELPPLRIAEAMTLDLFGIHGQRKKRMYVPSKGLLHPTA